MKRNHFKRFAALALSAVCGAACLAGCGTQPTAATALETIQQPKTGSYEDWELIQQTRQENPVSESTFTALDHFAYTTAAQVLGEDADGSYSPLSLYYALALAATGAAGETQTQMLDLLGISDPAQLSDQCAKLYRLLSRDNEVGTLRLANSLWMDQRVDWKQSFVTQAAQDFYAEVYQVDFTTDEAPKAMAQWVAQQTGGLLTPTFQPTDQQVLSLLNTVYFKDEWYDCFQSKNTQSDTFTKADGSQVTCDFMNREDQGRGFFRGKNFTRADVGLKNAGSMSFILPDVGTSVEELLASPETLQEALSGGEERSGTVTWKIPKFDQSSKRALEASLQALGIEQAFTKGADFSGLSNETATPIWISSVTQESRVAIDEKGVVAAAYTEVGMDAGAAPIEDPDQADMILDRPFLYAITGPEGELLFLGVCQDPTA